MRTRADGTLAVSPLAATGALRLVLIKKNRSPSALNAGYAPLAKAGKLLVDGC
jgi:hypothetical protein